MNTVEFPVKDARVLYVVSVCAERYESEKKSVVNDSLRLSERCLEEQLRRALKMVSPFQGWLISLLFSCIATVEKILVYFSIDDMVAIVKQSDILPVEGPLKKGMDCQVKEGRKIHAARVLEIGK